MILKTESDSPMNENSLTLETTITFIVLRITTPSFWWFDMKSILLVPCFQPRNWLQSEGNETRGWCLKEFTLLIRSLITHNYGKLKKKKRKKVSEQFTENRCGTSWWVSLSEAGMLASESGTCSEPYMVLILLSHRQNACIQEKR